MAAGVIPRAFFKEFLSTLFTSGSNLHVRLFVNNVTPTNTTAIADFVEASYPGYAAAVWVSNPISDDGNTDRLEHGVVSFLPPTSGSPVDVYGFWAEMDSPPQPEFGLVMSARFPGAPITLIVGGDGIAIAVDFRDFDANNP